MFNLTFNSKFVDVLRLSSIACMTLLASSQAVAGISIGGTRIVYPYDAKATSIKVINSSDSHSFLIQSWVEDASGEKSKDFVVTPPLYISGPKNENSLRIMFSGKPLPQDRESIYYFVSKTIPSVDKKETEGKNFMMLTAANRLKLFVRPAGLKPDAAKAPEELAFSASGKQLKITNPTPYYLTLTEIKVADKSVNGVMVAPFSKEYLDVPGASGKEISWRTINDQGATTPVRKNTVQ